VRTGISKDSYVKAVLALIVVSAVASAAELQPETVDAWRDYIQNANGRLQESLRARNSFLQTDKNSEMSARLQRGEVIVGPSDADTPKHVPGGLIHNWIASAFIPGVRAADVFGVLRNYAAYKQFYQPTVLESRDLGAAEAGEEFAMICRNRSMMSHTVVESDYQAAYTQLDENRWYSTASSRRIQEIENYGRADEHKLNVGEGSGYVWRLYTITKFEERDGGVFIEIEAIALSRDVPSSLHWMVDPMIRRVSKSYLTSFMTLTREAVRTRSETTVRTRQPQNLPIGTERGVAAASRDQ
jgi:hypothetical protein